VNAIPARSSATVAGVPLAMAKVRPAAHSRASVNPERLAQIVHRHLCSGSPLTRDERITL
jgi:hypothetical protein